MGSLKVLTFGWELAPVLSGGLGVVCRELTDAIVKKGVEVTFVLPKLPQEIHSNDFTLINAANYRVSQKDWKSIVVQSTLLPYGTLSDRVSNNGGKNFSFDNELYGANLIQEVERYGLVAQAIAKNVDCDIIHAHDWMTAIAALSAKAVLKKPMVFHVHSTEYDRSANNPYPLILNYERMALQNSDKIIAVSEYTKALLIDKYHIDSDKISVVHNAVDNESSICVPMAKNGREKVVLFLARLSIQKGADYLLRAAQKVLEKKKNVKFIFVGSGPMLNKLVEMSFELGIADKVVFAGALQHEDVDRAYQHADLFVMPSVSEPFGVTTLEAIKNGTPVLISKQSGVSEVIKNALKVDFWDIEMMASKILSVLNHEPLSQTLIQNGYHDLQKLTWDEQADKVIQIYHDMLK